MRTTPSTFSLRLLALSLLALAASPARRTAGAGSPGGEPARATYAIGDTVEDFALKDADGKEWRLSAARSTTAEAALATVLAAARAFDAPDAKAETAIDDLPGVREDGKPDPDKRLAFVSAAGRDAGLLPSARTAERLRTLEDAATWVKGAAKEPIVLMCWKTSCPTTRLYEDRVVALFRETGARLYHLATDPKESPEVLRAFSDSRTPPLRVLDDRDLAVTTRFGGRRTPHVFLLDEANRLRYAGAVDDDPAMTKEDAQRAHWLLDAIIAVQEQQTPDVLVTNAKGCAIAPHKGG